MNDKTASSPTTTETGVTLETIRAHYKKKKNVSLLAVYNSNPPVPALEIGCFYAMK